MISAREHLHHQLLKCCRSHATKMEWWQLIIQAIFFSEWYLLVDILVLYNWPIVTRKGNWPIQQVLYLPAFFLVPPSSHNPYYALHAIPLVPMTFVCLIISTHRGTIIFIVPLCVGSPRKSSQYTLDGACWNVLGNCTAQKKSTHWKWLLLRRCYFMPCGWSLAPQNFKLRNASCLSLPLGFSSSHF